MFRTIILNLLGQSQRGQLELILPDGTRRQFGGLSKTCVAKIRVHEDNFFRRSVLFGPIGFAESYMAGEWDTPDLTAVLAFFILNAEDSGAFNKPDRRPSALLNLLAASNRFLHTRRRNTTSKSKQNIQEHYDLSNEFFALWLDPGMTYSSALFDPADLSLEEAQSKKYERLCRKLRLAPSDHVLEIGTGWGGFCIHAAQHFGCRVTTTTISEEQFAMASERVRQEGLGDRVTVLLEDYRNLGGCYDKVVSIEMLEAVGDAYVDGYFAQCSRLLAPHGLLGLQAILCPDQQYRVLKMGVDFIQKHIFPGSLLMSNARILQATSATPALNLLDTMDMAPHYAKTLRIWRENFETKLPEVRALGFEEPFVRKWRYYLSYCEAAFATRFITVAQIVFTKTGNLALNVGSPIEDLALSLPVR